MKFIVQIVTLLLIIYFITINLFILFTNKIVRIINTKILLLIC